MVQRFNSVLLHDTLPVDLPDQFLWWQNPLPRAKVLGWGGFCTGTDLVHKNKRHIAIELGLYIPLASHLRVNARRSGAGILFRIMVS